MHLTLSKTGRKLYDGLIARRAERDARLPRLPYQRREAGRSSARSPSSPARRASFIQQEKEQVKTRITELLGIEHPIFQAAMSWASSNAPLVIAVSNAGGHGRDRGGADAAGRFRRLLSTKSRRERRSRMA